MWLGGAATPLANPARPWLRPQPVAGAAATLIGQCPRQLGLAPRLAPCPASAPHIAPLSCCVRTHQISNLTCFSGSVFVKKEAPIVDSCSRRYTEQVRPRSPTLRLSRHLRAGPHEHPNRTYLVLIELPPHKARHHGRLPTAHLPQQNNLALLDLQQCRARRQAGKGRGVQGSCSSLGSWGCLAAGLKAPPLLCPAFQSWQPKCVR